MASIITATTTSGLTQSADNSGVLQLASGVGNLVTVPAVTGTAMVSGNMPAFSSNAGTTTSLSNGTWTKLVMNTELFDTNSCYNNTGSTVTLNGISTPSYSFAPNVAGYYVITANTYVGFTGGSTNTTVGIFKNGTQYAYGSGSSGTSNTYFHVSTVVYLNGTSDYVSAHLYWTGSGANSDIGSSYTFTGSMLRAA